MSAAPNVAADKPNNVRRRPTRRTLAVIVALGVVTLLAVGWLADVLASLPRNSDSASSTIQTAHAGLDTVTLSVSPTPVLAGRDETFTVRVTDVAGQPLVGAHVVCALTMPQMSMRETSTEAQPAAQAGEYICAARLPQRGVWTVHVEVTPGTGQPARALFTISAG